MKRILILISFIVFSMTAFAQEEVDFTADRPGASTVPSATGGEDTEGNVP